MYSVILFSETLTIGQHLARACMRVAGATGCIGTHTHAYSYTKRRHHRRRRLARVQSVCAARVVRDYRHRRRPRVRAFLTPVHLTSVQLSSFSLAIYFFPRSYSSRRLRRRRRIRFVFISRSFPTTDLCNLPPPTFLFVSLLKYIRIII